MLGQFGSVMGLNHRQMPARCNPDQAARVTRTKMKAHGFVPCRIEQKSRARLGAVERIKRMIERREHSGIFQRTSHHVPVNRQCRKGVIGMRRIALREGKFAQIGIFPFFNPARGNTVMARCLGGRLAFGHQPVRAFAKLSAEPVIGGQKAAFLTHAATSA